MGWCIGTVLPVPRLFRTALDMADLPSPSFFSESPESVRMSITFYLTGVRLHRTVHGKRVTGRQTKEEKYSWKSRNICGKEGRFVAKLGSPRGFFQAA